MGQTGHDPLICVCVATIPPSYNNKSTYLVYRVCKSEVDGILSGGLFGFWSILCTVAERENWFAVERWT